MTDRLNIAIAQLNPVVGDIEGNIARIRDARRTAAGMDADLVVYTELVVVGYPPEDLVLKPAFQDDAEAAVRALAGFVLRTSSALHPCSCVAFATKDRPVKCKVVVAIMKMPSSSELAGL